MSKIAQRYRPNDVSLEQMLVFLFRNNPEAFAGKNMNRLRTGPLLSIPDPSEAGSVDDKEAKREVRLQTSNWNAYKDRLAEAAGMGAPTTDDLLQKMTAGFASDTHPDISYAFGSWASQLGACCRRPATTAPASGPVPRPPRTSRSGRYGSPPPNCSTHCPRPTLTGCPRRSSATKASITAVFPISASAAPLSPYWEFVVQLRPDASGFRTRLAGRVEHVVSGRAVEFGSAAALVTFMRRTGGSE